MKENSIEVLASSEKRFSSTFEKKTDILKVLTEKLS